MLLTIWVVCARDGQRAPGLLDRIFHRVSPECTALSKVSVDGPEPETDTLRSRYEAQQEAGAADRPAQEASEDSLRKESLSCTAASMVSPRPASVAPSATLSPRRTPRQQHTDHECAP